MIAAPDKPLLLNQNGGGGQISFSVNCDC